MQVVIFLRGINIGGKHVKMDLVKKIFEEQGFTNVKTILASGNVILESENKNINDIKIKIEKILTAAFPLSMQVIILSSTKMKNIYNQNPFKNISKTNETKFYISFFQGKPAIKIKFPFKMENFSILTSSNNCVYSIVTLTKNFGTVDAMEILERKFGKNITTRNWNTIEKIYSAVI